MARRLLLEEMPDLVIAGARDVPAAHAALEKRRASGSAFDAVILDLRLPCGSGEELIPWLRQNSPSTRIIIASTYLDDETCYRLHRAGLLALPKRASDEGTKPVSARVLKRALDEPPDPLGVFADANRLSPRQRQVVEGVLAGKHRKVIAADLGIKMTSVGEYIRRVLERVGCSSRVELFKDVEAGNTISHDAVRDRLRQTWLIGNAE